MRPPQPTSPARPPGTVTPLSGRPSSIVTGQVCLFLLLTYLLTWWVVPLRSDSFPVFPYGPDLALLVMVGLTRGRAGLGLLGRSLRRWRAHPGWYAVALLVPPVIGIAAVLATRAAGAPAAAMPPASSTLEFIVVLPIMTLVGGALGEELGWRGFLLPVLQRRLEPVAAVGLIVAAHAIWHLPLFLTSQPPAAAPFLIELAGGGIVLAWLMNSTRVVWLPILLHGAHNMSQQAFMSRFEGADLVTVQWFTATGWAALGVAVLVATRGRLVARGGAPLTEALHEQGPGVDPTDDAGTGSTTRSGLDRSDSRTRPARWGAAFIVLLTFGAALFTAPTASDALPEVRRVYGHTTLALLSQLLGLLAAAAFWRFARAWADHAPDRTRAPLMVVSAATAGAAALTAMPPLLLTVAVHRADTSTVLLLLHASDLSDVLLFGAIAGFAAVAAAATRGWVRPLAAAVTLVSAARAVLLLAGSPRLEVLAPLAFLALTAVVAGRSLVGDQPAEDAHGDGGSSPWTDVPR